MSENRARRAQQTGNTLVEFSLCAIPIIFILTSIFSMGMTMWNYHTLAEAAKFTARAASVHGKNCVGKTCAWTVGDAAKTFAKRAIGIPSSRVSVTFNSAAGTNPCNPLSSCLSNATLWPAASAPGTTDVTVSASYTPRMFGSMWAPGAGGLQFSRVTIRATSTQMVLY